MPNQPEMRMKTLTPTSEHDSLKALEKDLANEIEMSEKVGGFKDV